MYTKGEATGAVKAFLDFILSADYGKEIENRVMVLLPKCK